MNKHLQNRLDNFIASNPDLASIAPKKLKLLDTSGGNTKIAKTDNASDGRRFAGLSLKPNVRICNGSIAADCLDVCLNLAGQGRFSNVQAGRQFKTELYLRDPELFLDILRSELDAFQVLCTKQNLIPTVRLNVLSDIDYIDIIKAYPNIDFYDYTKIAKRLDRELPSNYKLMFSYSGASTFKGAAEKAFKTNLPISVVFRGDMPEYFNGRKVINGDASDWVNCNSGPVVVGLVAKGPAKSKDSGLVIDTTKDLIAMQC